MIPKAISRRLRPVWFAAFASAAWSNRTDLRRWLRFGRRVAADRRARPVADVLTEARVRLAVSRDPLLRRDPELVDLDVDDGVVTLLTSTTAWPDPGSRFRRLDRVKGINDVHSRATSSLPTEEVKSWN